MNNGAVALQANPFNGLDFLKSAGFSVMKGGDVPPFAHLLATSLDEKRQNWQQVENAVENVALGIQDSETVIPLVAQTMQEMQVCMGLVEAVMGSLKKLLETQI